MFMDVVVFAGIGTVLLMIGFLVAFYVFIKNADDGKE